MHAAPAVSVCCGQSAVWRWLHAALPALAATALAAWGLGHLQWAAWPALLLAPGVAALAWWWPGLRPRPRPQRLAWDGQQWTADGCAVRLDLMMDLGHGMLLRLRPIDDPGRSLWIPIGVADAGVDLHALRAAVYCRPPESTRRARPALPAQGGGVATPD